MSRYLAIVLIALLSLSIVSAQKGASSWTLTEVQPLRQLLGEEYEPTAFVYLSPDGSALAWLDSNISLSVYNFENGGIDIYPWPKYFRNLGTYSSPAWSPDGQYLAFSESLFDNLVESDLWMLDRNTGEIINRTDDGILGDWFEAEKPFALDYLPTWNPTTNDLYFFRSTRLFSDDKTELYLMPVERDEPKLIADITNDVMALSIYRATGISPDGTRLAFMSVGGDLENEMNGLWILDLKSGEAEQITSLPDLWVGLPESLQYFNALILPETLMWAGNNGLVLQSRAMSFESAVPQIAHYIDVASRAITPITAFDDLNLTVLSDLYFSDYPESPILRVPRAGVVTPDGSTFIFLRYTPGLQYAGISAVALPPDGSAPVALGEIENFEIDVEATMPPIMSADGKALMGGYLLQFEPAS